MEHLCRKILQQELDVTLALCHQEKLKNEVILLDLIHCWSCLFHPSECVESKRPNLITHLNRTPIFEWHVVRCGSKNGHPKDMCFREIGLHDKP